MTSDCSSIEYLFAKTVRSATVPHGINARKLTRFGSYVKSLPFFSTHPSGLPRNFANGEVAWLTVKPTYGAALDLNGLDSCLLRSRSAFGTAASNTVSAAVALSRLTLSSACCKMTGPLPCRTWRRRRPSFFTQGAEWTLLVRHSGDLGAKAMRSVCHSGPGEWSFACTPRSLGS